MNLAFTSLPVILMGIFDQDVSDKVSLAVPQLYRKGMERREWSEAKFWFYMGDGIYQSAICYFMGYLLFAPATFETENGRGVADRSRMGVYIACATITVVNAYILLNLYRWDWLTVLITVISTLLIFFWTGVYSSFEGSFQFYKSGAEVYGTLTFWSLLLLIVMMCLLPRFCIKYFQKLYRPYDIDVVREQVRQGKFDYLDQYEAFVPPKATMGSGSSSETAEVADEEALQQKGESSHARFPSMTESARPIYPPSEAPTFSTRQPHSQTGSDGTDRTVPSLDFTRPPLPRVNTSPETTRPTPKIRVSADRFRPSFERQRSSFERLERTRSRQSLERPMRPSFELSRDFSSAAYLTRVESSYSQPGLTPVPTNQARRFTDIREERERGDSIVSNQ